VIDNSPVWIEINCEGETTKTKYFGKFEIKRYLSFKEKSDVARLFETYSRGITEDIAQKGILYALAQLNFHVLSADCDWWKEKGLDILDEEPIVQLLAEVRKAQVGNKKDEPAPTAEKTA
jgi:hypothetical protein